MPFRELVPVLAGEGVTTIATLANVVPSQIGPKAGRWHVSWILRAGDGKMIERGAQSLTPSQRIDIDAGAKLRAGQLAGGPWHSGTLMFTYHSLDRALVGSMRPHFTVLSANSAASVHSQGHRGKRETAFATTRGALSQEQFVFAMNCGGNSQRFQIKVTETGGEESCSASAVDLPPHGAALVPLSMPERNPGCDFVVECLSSRPSKAYLLISAEGSRRLSFDHL